MVWDSFVKIVFVESCGYRNKPNGYQRSRFRALTRREGKLLSTEKTEFCRRKGAEKEGQKRKGVRTSGDGRMKTYLPNDKNRVWSTRP